MEKGAISLDYINQISSRIEGPPANKMMDKDGTSVLCWSLKMSSGETVYSVSAAKLQQNKNQNYVLRILDLLYSLGWITVDRADTARGIYMIRYGWQPPQ